MSAHIEILTPARQETAFGVGGRAQTPFVWLLGFGLLAIILPTLIEVARVSWSTEQGAHGPIVLATGIWLVIRSRIMVRDAAAPGGVLVTTLLLAPSLLLYVAASITGTIELEGLAMFSIAVAVLYCIAGGAVLRLLWFPLFYLAFILPPPDSLVTLVTQPLKIGISQGAVDLLYTLGYPIAGSGVRIQIAQYQVLVAEACAGLNSLISLTAIGLFYVYIRHNANWKYAALLAVAIVPIAIAANFIRVMLLILITYHFGDAAAQGFVHNLAGITMFSLSLVGIYLVDAVARPLRQYVAQERTDG